MKFGSVKVAALSVLLGSCKHTTIPTSQAQATPDQRSQIGNSFDYIPDSRSEKDLAPLLAGSMKERRRKGWEILNQVLKPVAFGGGGTPVPLWLTWYELDELSGLFRTGLNSLSPSERNSVRSNAGLPEKAIDAALGSSKLQTIADKLTAGLAKNQSVVRMDLDPKSMQRLGIPMISPAFARHLLANATNISNCDFDNLPSADNDLESTSNFSVCPGEYPKSAVMAKSSWVKLSDGVSRFDYSAKGWSDYFASNKLPQVNQSIPLATNNIYQITDSRGTVWGLTGLHITTKDTRKWVWVSLMWGQSPGTDLASDNPNPFPAPWNQYQMVVVTDFLEKDPTPWIGANGKELEVLKTVYSQKMASEPKGQVTTWGTNPFIEIDDPKSNCIGCHQHGVNFAGNEQNRKNFPTDFTFQTAMKFKKIFRDGLR
jgi:hypothetical protein